MDRRKFLKHGALSAAAIAVTNSALAETTVKKDEPIGFNHIPNPKTEILKTQKNEQ